MQHTHSRLGILLEVLLVRVNASCDGAGEGRGPETALQLALDGSGLCLVQDFDRHQGIEFAAGFPPGNECILRSRSAAGSLLASEAYAVNLCKVLSTPILELVIVGCNVMKVGIVASLFPLVNHLDLNGKIEVARLELVGVDVGALDRATDRASLNTQRCGNVQSV